MGRQGVRRVYTGRRRSNWQLPKDRARPPGLAGLGWCAYGVALCLTIASKCMTVMVRVASKVSTHSQIVQGIICVRDLPMPMQACGTRRCLRTGTSGCNAGLRSGSKGESANGWPNNSCWHSTGTGWRGWRLSATSTRTSYPAGAPVYSRLCCY